MFSAGNISEKIRVAGFRCVGETVVDLYAGIGYFTLSVLHSFLLHCTALHCTGAVAGGGGGGDGGDGGVVGVFAAAAHGFMCMLFVCLFESEGPI